MSEIMEKTVELSGRKRKKLFLKLRVQMEFYFSDSNLAKDKFLYNLVCQDKDGYVDLEVFKSFNKIRALSQDLSFLAASLTKSDILQLNEDKSRVRRKTSIQISKDFDACTLYVEGLPQYADLKWIKNIFDHFGTVEYITIPRFNISQKIKGFAFIEFNEPESVVKACEFYKNSADIKNGSSKKEGSSVEETDEEKSDLANKRKLETDDRETEKPSKKQKIKEDIVNINEDDVKTKKAIDHETDSAEYSHQASFKVGENSELGAGDKEPSSKSKRKRKHSKKNNNRHEKPTLRVMSKSEWKGYRNKYLDLQRSTMSYLKKQILLECHEIREQESHAKIEPVIKKELKFQPGVIIKIKLPKTIENSAEVKEQIKSSAVVAYIDAPMGSDEVFIRCHASEDASLVLKDKKLNGLGDVMLLSGRDEEEYWEKIQRDREHKLNTPVTRKKRGRDKLIAKAAKLIEHRNKHIYFDE